MDVLSCVVAAAVESWAISRLRLLDALAVGNSGIELQLEMNQIFWALLIVQYLTLKYYRIFLYHRYFSPLRHLPGPTADNHPFLGQLLNEFRADSPVALYEKWLRDFPEAPLLRYLSFANAEVVVANSLAAQREILQTQCYAFQKSAVWNRLTRDITGEGISTLEFGAHRAHRRVLGAPFASANVRGRLGPVFRGKAVEFCGVLDELLLLPLPLPLPRNEVGSSRGEGEGEGEERAGGKTAVISDCVSLFSRATLDIVGIATLGVELAHIGQTTTRAAATPPPKFRSRSQPREGGEEEEEEYTFHKAYRQIFTPDTLGKILLFLNAHVPTRWVPIAGNRRFQAATAWLRRVLTELVRRRRREIAEAVAAGEYGSGGDEKSGGRRDLLSFLVEESLLPGGTASGMDEDLIVGDIMTFIGAGSDTPAMTIAWCLHTMIAHPEAQDKLREESAQLAARNPEPSCADIDALPYMNVFLKEVLRLYPPTNAVHREAAEDVTIEGIRIPKGTTFIIPLRCASLNPLVWGDDAAEFRPSRWEEKQVPDPEETTGDDSKQAQYASSSSSLSPFAFAAFSNGPRICPGKGFAIYETKAILFELVRRYRFLEVVGGFTLENPSLNLRPRGMNIRFEKIGD